MAFFIVNFIYTVTERLNRRFPLTGNLTNRILFQIILGFLIPSIVLFLLACLFFWINDVDMMSTSYAKLEWWFSILFVILVNCYYIIRYLMRRVLFQEKGKSKSTNLDSSDGLIVKHGNEQVWIPTHEITYIQPAEKAALVHVVSGQQYLTEKTTKILVEELDPRQFYEVRRSHIINRSVVVGYEPASSNRLRLKTTLQEEFYVSQRSRADFKKWWEGE